MGRAISRRPNASLMDEPLSNLDAKLRNHLSAGAPRSDALMRVVRGV